MSDPTAALAGLPEMFRKLLPEIFEIGLPAEPRSDCSACVMAHPLGGEPTRDRPFSPEGRCCTYHPAIPNFLLGRVLRDGGPGAQKIRDRLLIRDGVSAFGIRPPDEEKERYDDMAPSRFGQDLSFRCPYWVGGELACGVWGSRNGVCRTWHCRVDGGPRALALWETVREALTQIEERAAIFLAMRGNAPGSRAKVDDWVRWYIDCADRADALTDADLHAVGGDELAALRASFLQRGVDLEAPMPERLGPAVRDFQLSPGAVRLVGYSGWDPIVAPAKVFELFAAMEGGRPWRQALAEVDDPSITPALVEALYERGLVEPWGDDHDGGNRIRIGPLLKAMKG